jgi:hypothetical protein
MLSDRSYAVRLYRSNRLLFAIVVLFFSVSFAVNFLIKTEVTPFFKWDLYAAPIPAQKQYSFLEVRYNDNRLLNFPHTWQEPEKLFFTNTMDLFIATKKNNNRDPLRNYFEADWLPRHPFYGRFFNTSLIFNDTAEINAFPAWYKRYLSQHIGEPVDSIKIFERKIEYQDDGSVREVSSELIYTIP